MFLYELRKWLTKINDHKENHENLTELQILHIEEMLWTRDDPQIVAMDMLSAAIEVAHVDGGKDGILEFAEYMRNMADSIEVRVKRSEIRSIRKTIPKDVANQANPAQT